MNRLFLVLSASFLLSTGSVSAASYKEGFDAYLQGDYPSALKILQPLAKSGNVYAQHSLGVMYENGQGVRQDYEKAFKWYYSAAEKGLMPAQNNIGPMYSKGLGVKQSYIEAAKWY